MTSPVVAQKAPYIVEVEAGTTYYWCSCGLSKNQPFCDGSHKSTDLTPVPYTATESKKVAMCGCKHSKTGQLCDGSHKTL
jgi:CDGSH iron-sulfur domain-containing protein 3